MRGKVKKGVMKRTYLRITPAYAGKRNTVTETGFYYGDHPRLCGEKFRNDQIGSPIQGSPPPMRGKADDISNYYLKLRITPAYAGKSVKSIDL